MLIGSNVEFVQSLNNHTRGDSAFHRSERLDASSEQVLRSIVQVGGAPGAPNASDKSIDRAVAFIEPLDIASARADLVRTGSPR